MERRGEEGEKDGRKERRMGGGEEEAREERRREVREERRREERRKGRREGKEEGSRLCHVTWREVIRALVLEGEKGAGVRGCTWIGPFACMHNKVVLSPDVFTAQSHDAIRLAL